MFLKIRQSIVYRIRRKGQACLLFKVLFKFWRLCLVGIGLWLHLHFSPDFWVRECSNECNEFHNSTF